MWNEFTWLMTQSTCGLW